MQHNQNHKIRHNQNGIEEELKSGMIENRRHLYCLAETSGMHQPAA
jgi:hypothetical protein